MEIRIQKFNKGWQLAIVSTSNGTVIATSRGYTRKQNAREAAKTLKAKMGKAKIVELA
jgi:uncharacterized protein YegP (UPF0339 family)